MRAILLTIIPILFSGLCFSAGSKADSLKLILKNEKNEIKKVDILNQIALSYVESAQHDSILKYAGLAQEIAIKNSYFKGIAESNKRIAVVYYDRGDNEKSLMYYLRSYNYYKKSGDVYNTAILCTAVGNVYMNTSKFDKALEQYIRSQELIDSIIKVTGTKKEYSIAQSNNFNNIGNVFYYQGDLEKTEEYYLKALKIYKDVNDQVNIANCYINLGMVARSRKDFVKSIDYRMNALETFTKSDNVEGIAYCHLGLGNTFWDMNNRSKAIYHIGEALRNYEEMGSKKGCIMVYINLGEIYASAGQFGEAIHSLDTALNLSFEINSAELRKEVYSCYANVYQQKGDFRNAFVFSQKLSEIKDSIYSEQNRTAIAEMQTRFETQAKEKENELLKKESRLQQLEISKKESEARQQKILLITFICFAVVVSFFLVLVIRMFVQKKKTNKLLEKRNSEVLIQKEEISAQRDEILTQRDMLAVQKERIEYIHKELTSSIQYAKRIQNAILPPQYFIDKIIPDHFILYLAKDVVSGDFYFFDKIGDKIIFAAVDCTGHGVPGALMSVIGNSWLVQAVREKVITSPEKILSFLDEGVNKTLRQTAGESGVSDGMDLALCTLDIKTGLLQYSGAYNSLYYVSNDQMHEIKADKIPIGTNVDGVADRYTNHTIQLDPGNMVYLFSDGFPDQFGGPKGKKFKYQPLKDLLLKISNEPVKEQKSILEKTLFAWQGKLEQVDDIVILGIRIPDYRNG